MEMLDTPTIEPGVVGSIIGGLALLFGFVLWGTVALKRAFRRWRFGDDKRKIVKSWKDVEDLIARGDEMSARLAVMHADAVLDKALQAKHFPGDRFATRMQFAIHKYGSLKKVWWAHRLRNDLAHDPHRSLKMGEARKAIATFKSALRDLGAL